ncbi:MAG: PAS domain S-box protein, partial [Sphingobacteriaceae bacterium]
INTSHISDAKTAGLVNKAMNLAHIGGWEIDMLNRTVYWSDITRAIHEVNDDFEPDFETSVSFYREGNDRDHIVQELADTIEKGTPSNIELQIITAKGNTKWVRVIGEAEFTDGKCIRVCGSFQDIDDRKKAEIAAKKLLEERNTILESIGDAFFATDKNWTVTYWNQTAEKVLHKSKEETLDHNLWEVFSDSVDSLSYKKYHQAVSTNQVTHFEDHYPPLNKWYEITAYPSNNGLSVYFKDVTERKRISLELEESEKKYSELFQLSPMPMWVFDLRSLYFLDVNVAAIKKYGYTRKEFLAMTIKDIRPAEDIQILEDALAKITSNEPITRQGIIRHKKRNGEIINVDIQSNPVNYKGKKARVIIANDVTERLKYIKAIEDHNLQLIEISWIQSHIVRAPLSRIMGLIQLVKIAAGDDDENEKIMEYILASANELDEVIKSINDKTITYPAENNN